MAMVPSWGFMGLGGDGGATSDDDGSGFALTESFQRNRPRFLRTVSCKFLPKQARFPTSFPQNRPGFP